MDEILSFEAIWRPDARILVLGTMPSRASLEAGFYYAHPQNAFWRLMAEILRVSKPSTDEEKGAILKDAKIALWDVAHSCVRPGSLDSSITHVKPNDVKGLISMCPDIRRVLFNGQKAAELFRKHIGRIETIECLTLPSTSPAYTLSYEKKLAAWRKAITLEEYNERD